MKKLITLLFACSICAMGLKAQTTSLTLNLNKPGANVSPKLYGLMTEEINHSYVGVTKSPGQRDVEVVF